ncbi:MAG: IS1182 family transposase, partial [Methanobrevibacter sp.]|nr:IS1182 family transposase [Methanobrevibacter sp.]
MVLQEDKIGQTFLLPLNLNDLIPSDHICHYVTKLVNCYDFDDIHEKFIGTAGGKAYSRRMLLRLLLLATIEGYKSSRDIEKQTKLNTPYMWICGFDTPTYRTILNFKNDYKDLISEMLAIVLVDARNEGLVKLGVIALDGTIMKANASNKNTVTEEILELAQQLIDESIIQDQEDDEKYGEEEVGEEVAPKLSLKKKIKKLVEASQEKAKEEKKDIEKINPKDLKLDFAFTPNEAKQIKKAYNEIDVVKKQRKRSKDSKIKNKPIIISLTDPTSRFMHNKKGYNELSFNIQNIVDCESGLILQSKITQDPTDHYQLIPQIENLQQNPEINMENSKFVADTAYNTQEAIEYLYNNNIDAFIPNQRQASENKNRKFREYAKANFKYISNKNQFICPEKHILHHKNSYKENNKIKKVYYTNQCKNCPTKDKCSPKSNYRIITHYSNKYQDLMAQKMEKEENKEIYKKRANSERPFAYMKHDLEWT